MRRLKFCLILVPCLIFGSWQAETEDEALFLRRIADFWEEGEYLVAKAQIEEFLTAYPNSGFGDTLRAALADLLLREKNYSEALHRYTEISQPEIANRCFLNRMQCLYHLGWYATLADSCEEFLQQEPPQNPQQKLQTTYFLAIALYQQCLNTAKDPETPIRLAIRAKPYFETLLESELSSEAAQAFAHLSCILKDYSKAAKIILDQAKKMPESEEELLFQAALIQAEYDKDLAIQSFSQIAKAGKGKSKDAAYNCLVLSFDMGHFDELVAQKETFLSKIPEERIGLAHLFLGRSFLALKKYSDAVTELKAYLSATDPSSTEFERAALLSLLEASFHANDLPSFDFAHAQFLRHFSHDPELANIFFTRCQILKKSGEPEEARQSMENLLAECPDFTQKNQVLFELIQLDYNEKRWQECVDRARLFLHTIEPQHELTPYTWRYLLSSLLEQGEKKQLIEELLSALQQPELFQTPEKADWQFILAKTYYEQGEMSQAQKILSLLLEEKQPFPQQANVKLLAAFCYRDQEQNLEQFCKWAEEAIREKTNLLDPGPLHAALFNAYLQRSISASDCLPQAEDHLYAAFEAKEPIEQQNLLWLIERYGEKFPERSAAILDRCISASENPLATEPLVCRRAKIHQLLGEHQAAVALLEPLLPHYADSSLQWHHEAESKLLFAQNLLALQKKEKAIPYLEEVLSLIPTLRSEISAQACLERARLRVADWKQRKAHPTDPEIQKAMVDFKKLTLQRTLANEPIHLEAALDYIALQTELELPQQQISKELALLTKAKHDFESAEDLLSKDYQESRAKYPQKTKIYEGYLRFIEACILCCQAKQPQSEEAQNKLRAKAKELLLQIVDDRIHPTLTARCQMQLERFL